MIKSKPKIVYAIAVMVVLITSCESFDSEDVNQQRITTEYKLKFDEAENQTRADAVFRFGSNNYMILNDPAFVKFDDRSMIKLELFGITTYRLIRPGKITSGVFHYRNAEGDDFINNILLADKISPAEGQSISISEGGELKWVGSTLSPGEEATVMLYNNNTEHFSKSTRESGTVAITIEPNEIEDTEFESTRIVFVRERRRNVQEGTEAGGSLVGTYQSGYVPIEVVE